MSPINQNTQSQPQPHHCGIQQEQSTELKSFFVVQKCWYSGPKVTPTLDYLRLIPSVSEAEQVAYQSAQTYSGGVTPVRTIQLSNKQSAASTYGFVSSGTLFWVRRILAYTAAGVPVSSVIDSAHCILTNGVIGGTGNGNSRRGSEDINSVRVFVGPAGYAWALKQSTNGQVPAGSTCQWVPVGKPNLSNITGEWPDRNTWNTVMNHQMNNQGHGKRISESTEANHWFSSSSCSDSDPDEPLRNHDNHGRLLAKAYQESETSFPSLPPAKRLCSQPNNPFQMANGGFQIRSMPSISIDVTMEI